MTADPVNTGDGGPDPGSDSRASPFSWPGRRAAPWSPGLCWKGNSPSFLYFRQGPPDLSSPRKAAAAWGMKVPKGSLPLGPCPSRLSTPVCPAASSAHRSARAGVVRGCHSAAAIATDDASCWGWGAAGQDMPGALGSPLGQAGG